MLAKNVLPFQLESRAYDISSGQVSFNGIAVQMLGAGTTESGIVGPGWNSNLSGFSETARGSWMRAGATGFRALTFSGGNARGAFIDRVGFVQTHPNPTAGWAPTAYDYLIENVNSQGGLKIGADVMFLGINKGIICDTSGRLHLRHFQGQFYTEGLYLDNAFDSTFIDSAQIYPFNGGPDPVIQYMNQNCKLLRIKRCDGIFGGNFFCLGVGTALSLETGTNGVATNIHFDSFWADCSKLGISHAAANARVDFNKFIFQGENLAAHDRSPISGSAACISTSASGGGLMLFGNTSVERIGANAFQNNASSTFVINGTCHGGILNGHKLFSASASSPAYVLSNMLPAVTDVSGPVGAQGTDYITAANDQVITILAPPTPQETPRLPMGRTLRAPMGFGMLSRS